MSKDDIKEYGLEITAEKINPEMEENFKGLPWENLKKAVKERTKEVEKLRDKVEELV